MVHLQGEMFNHFETVLLYKMLEFSIQRIREELYLCEVFVQCLQDQFLILLHHGQKLGQLSVAKLFWYCYARIKR